MCFQKIYRLKKDSDLQQHSKKGYTHFIEILQAKGHFEYLNGGYPFNQIEKSILIRFVRVPL